MRFVLGWNFWLGGSTVKVICLFVVKCKLPPVIRSFLFCMAVVVAVLMVGLAESLNICPVTLGLSILVVIRLDKWLPGFAVEIERVLGVLLQMVIGIGLLVVAAVSVFPEVEGWIHVSVHSLAFRSSFKFEKVVESVRMMERLWVPFVDRLDAWVFPRPVVELFSRPSFISDVVECIFSVHQTVHHEFWRGPLFVL